MRGAAPPIATQEGRGCTTYSHPGGEGLHHLQPSRRGGAAPPTATQDERGCTTYSHSGGEGLHHLQPSRRGGAAPPTAIQKGRGCTTYSHPGGEGLHHLQPSRRGGAAPPTATQEGRGCTTYSHPGGEGLHKLLHILISSFKLLVAWCEKKARGEKEVDKGRYRRFGARKRGYTYTVLQCIVHMWRCVCSQNFTPPHPHTYPG